MQLKKIMMLDGQLLPTPYPTLYITSTLTYSTSITAYW